MPLARRSFVFATLLALLLADVASLHAQAAQAPEWAADSIPFIGSEAEDRERVAQLLGRGSTSGWLVRSLSSRTTTPAPDSLRWAWVTPELFMVNNSELPFSQNDGLLWAGRGTSFRVRGGIAAARGSWRLVLVPEAATTTNKGFVDVDVVGAGWNRPAYDPSKTSQFASPWNQNPVSADVPIRFGESAYDQVGLGQSALWYERGAVAAGISTENLWWGPGVHDALVMTNNAEGVPHAFVRTARPVRTAVGEFEGRLIVGALVESGHFDFDPSNDHRSLSAAAVSYRPRWEPNLTLGVARAVYAPVGSPVASLGHVLPA